MFLPKYGIKNYNILPTHYCLNEIPSFYFYNKNKLSNSMYSRFVQVNKIFIKYFFIFLILLKINK